MIIKVPRLKEILDLIPRNNKKYDVFYSHEYFSEEEDDKSPFIYLTKTNCHYRLFSDTRSHCDKFYNFTFTHDYKYLISNKPISNKTKNIIISCFHKEYIYLKYKKRAFCLLNKLNKINQNLINTVFKRIHQLNAQLNNTDYYCFTEEQLLEKNELNNRLKISLYLSKNHYINFSIQKYTYFDGLYMSKLFINNEKLLTKILQQFIIKDLAGKL